MLERKKKKTNASISLTFALTVVQHLYTDLQKFIAIKMNRKEKWMANRLLRCDVNRCSDLKRKNKSAWKEINMPRSKHIQLCLARTALNVPVE